MEPLIYEAILEKCRMTDGVYAHGIGGTETHVHLAISIEPTINISKFIGETKGASSYDVNSEQDDHHIDWKRGYGVVSFSKRDLPWVLTYIANQKEHHRLSTVSDKLEKTESAEL